MATDYRQLAREKAEQYGIDPDIFERQIKQESGFNPNAYNKGSGARGLGQFMPATWNEWGKGADINDGEANLDASARYMAHLAQKYNGDYSKALAAYNWGMGNVDRKGMDRAPQETQDYLARILPDGSKKK